MKNIYDRLDEIRHDGYDLDFGSVFNDAFEIYKRTALMSGLAMLLFAIVVFALVLGGFGIVAAAGGDMSFMADFSQGQMSVVGRLIYMGVMCVLAALSAPFSASLIRMAHLADKGEDVSFSNAFDCFKAPYFMPLFLEALIVSFFTVFISTAIQIAFPLNIIMGLLGSVINIVISVLMVMAVPLIVFGNLKPIEAIQNSAMVVSKSPLIIIGLLIVSGILACVGVIAFCLGVFFTVPIVFATYYAIYKHSVGVEQREEFEDIGATEF